MSKYYIGIDLGTSSVRAFLTEFDTGTSCVSGENYDVSIPQPGYAEQDPRLWWDKTVDVLRALLSKSSLPPQDIAAVSFSGQMHGLVALDENGLPVMNVPVWLDQRSAGAISEIYATLGSELVLTNTQNRVSPGFLLASLYWYKTRKNDLYRRIARVMLPKDYIKYRLSGVIATDYSDAAGSLAFDNVNMRWAKPVIEGLGLNMGLFPEILPSTAVVGHVTREAARETGLSENTLVVSGGADQCMQSIGNAVIDEGVCACNIGTSALICTPASKPLFDGKLRLNTFAHALPGRYSVMAACLNGGSAMKWLARTIFGMEDYAEIDRLVNEREAGAGGLIFLPYMAGERTPHMDPKARGVFFGLTYDHTRGDMARALMEGVVFGLKDGLGVLEEIGVKCRRVVAAGGGARSDAWLQMQADIFERDVYRSASKEQACLGAAITAAVGSGAFKDYGEACAKCVEPPKQTFSPKSENVAVYEKTYEIFRELYKADKPSFDRVSDIFKIN